MSRGQRLARLLARLAVGAAIFLVVAELGLRVVGLGQPYYSAPEAYVSSSDPDVLFLPRPGFEGLSEGNVVKINSRGLRDPERSVSKPEGTTRILVLGDSVAFGFGVRNDETMESVLEQRLNADSEGRYEVLNAAVVGYNTIQERARLQDVGLQYQPDLVVLVFVVNDLLDTFSIFDHQYQPTGVLAPLKVWLRRNSNLYRLYQNTLWRAMDDIRRGPVRVEQPRDRARVLEREAEILKIASITRSHQASFLLALYPDNLYQYVTPDAAGRQATVRQELTEFAARNGLLTLDLSDAIGDVRDPRARTMRLREDPHPSPTGQRAIADALYETLRSSSLLPVSRQTVR
ncbi:MAG: hypothetical protein IT307_02200 [Chloroflexi bacterium]|nr:hypothetical protein [Chloroflexota bacterium]